MTSTPMRKIPEGYFDVKASRAAAPAARVQAHGTQRLSPLASCCRTTVARSSASIPKKVVGVSTMTMNPRLTSAGMVAASRPAARATPRPRRRRANSITTATVAMLARATNRRPIRMMESGSTMSK